MCVVRHRISPNENSCTTPGFMRIAKRKQFRRHLHVHRKCIYLYLHYIYVQFPQTLLNPFRSSFFFFGVRGFAEHSSAEPGVPCFFPSLNFNLSPLFVCVRRVAVGSSHLFRIGCCDAPIGAFYHSDLLIECLIPFGNHCFSGAGTVYFPCVHTLAHRISRRAVRYLCSVPLRFGSMAHLLHTSTPTQEALSL